VMENKSLTCNLSRQMARRCARYLARFSLELRTDLEGRGASRTAFPAQNMRNEIGHHLRAHRDPST
jgi:hypothetical protein